LGQKLNKAVEERDLFSNELQQTKSEMFYISKENTRLKLDVADLSRQVQDLLQEIEKYRQGENLRRMSSEDPLSTSFDPADVSDRLFSFRNIHSNPIF